MGHMHVLKMKALLYWLKDRDRRGIDIYEDYDEDFGQVELLASIKSLETYERLQKAGETKNKAPDKFQPHSLRGWSSFNRDLENYLSGLRGISGVPLIYVIREERAIVAMPGGDDIDQLIRLAPLQGPSYLEDKRRVYRIIRDAVSGTDGWIWIQDVKNEDRRLAIKRLRDHYDGPGASTQRVQDAKERLKVCHYKSETTFPFERYVSVLKECFATLEDDECPITERDKIDYLLEGIQNVGLTSAISNISMTTALRSSFEETSKIFYYARSSAYSLSPQTKGREQSPKWNPTMIIQGRSEPPVVVEPEEADRPPVEEAGEEVEVEVEAVAVAAAEAGSWLTV